MTLYDVLEKTKRGTEVYIEHALFGLFQGEAKAINRSMIEISKKAKVKELSVEDGKIVLEVAEE